MAKAPPAAVVAVELFAAAASLDKQTEPPKKYPAVVDTSTDHVFLVDTLGSNPSCQDCSSATA